MAAARAAKAAAAATVGAIGFKVLDSKTQIAADISLLKRSGKALSVLKLGQKIEDMSIADVWAEGVKKWPDNTFVIFEHRRLTWRDMDMLSNQMAHWLIQQGIGTGDAVALVMENKAEFIAWELALAKIGAMVALINFNVKQKGLIHCIKAASCKAVLFDGDTEDNIYNVEADLDGVKFFCWAGMARQPFKQVLEVTHDILLSYPRDGSAFKAMRKGIKMSSTFGYIYTSGTTGLPKAANILHVKFLAMGSMVMMAGLGPGDRLYTCLPIFHSAGGGIGVAGCILTGTTMVLARKFSNSRFWYDIMAHECTGFQYIGELGRYLVNYAKDHPEIYKLQHKLKAAIGNGLRPEVWNDFQDGFRIPLVAEFYGATEGNGSLVNFCERSDLKARGAVGRLGSLAKKFMSPTIMKFDVESEEIIRGPDGFCIECAPGEAGELCFPNKAGDPIKTFQGYTDEKSTSKKLLKDAFREGDSWFRTGDLVSRDSQGFYFFVDRIGDTFRWKGENCSTMEISEIVSTFPGVSEANVYGVKVPGSMDGRACMVAVNARPEITTRENLDSLLKLCQKELPAYAVPLFLRILPDMEITATMKHQKVQLRDQGCDPSKVSDELFWLSPASKRYEKFSSQEYQMLENGRSKL
eukprot:TRINITY_DN9959_c0_g1_i1.p1 TRINITY_DN9959_c0_g1~~TRINITY_DN9959_c0_g1_i1.p1  ORF type:complete len:637 (-),score=129.87 TRINITY_DN9959_c0_g1_i1:52-1962(-)